MKRLPVTLFTVCALTLPPAVLGQGGPAVAQVVVVAEAVAGSAGRRYHRQLVYGTHRQVQNNGNGATVIFNYNPRAAALGLGTTGESDFLVQSPEAINIPANIRVYQNNRDAAARGQIMPVPLNINAGEGLMDLLADTNRQLLYITNSGMNRIEVFDMKAKQFLSPIKTGQLPHNMAFGTDGNTLYVANTGGESISIIDLNLRQIVDKVKFPPTPVNASVAIITPQAMAASIRGPLVIMSDGSLWKIDGNQATKRSLNQVVFGTGATTISAGTGTAAFRSMASTPEGQYILVFTGTGNAYIYDATADDFTIGKQIFSTQTGYLGPVSAGPRGQYYIVNGVLLNSSLTPIGNIPNSSTVANTGTTGTGLPGFGGTTTTTTATRPTSAVSYVGSNSYAIFSTPIRANANTAATDAGIIQILDVTTGNPTAAANALEGPASTVTGNARAVVAGRTMTFDSTGSNAYVLTASGLSIIPMTAIPPTVRPALAQNGVANLANYQPSISPGSLVGIFGANLATQATASTSPLPTVLGGTCVTLNNVAIPLLATAPGQINAQIPTTLAAGTYPLVVHSISSQATSLASLSVKVAKYAPAVFTDTSGRAAIYHQNGQPVTASNPTTRDQRLVMYATGLGPTTGGTVTTGLPAPSKPLAVTGPVSVYFGPSNYSQSAIIVEWSGLVPGLIGVYQIDLYVPGTHMNGNALPVMVKVGGVSSPVSGSLVPTVAVN